MNGVTGQPLFLHCIAKGYPKSIISWRRWGSVIATSDISKQIFQNGTLVVNSFGGARDTGEFECLAHNDYGTTSKSVYVRSIGM